MSKSEEDLLGIRSAARANFAKSMVTSINDVKKAYGSGINNILLSGAMNGFYMFAENFYINLYGSIDKEDFEKFEKECGLPC
jgi:hypothetical protein